jgi:hypothetical protein
METNREFSLLLRHVTGIADHEAIRRHYERYCREIGFPGASQGGFSSRLARYALKGSFRLRLVDIWTRLFDRNNLIRHKLNLVVALAECSPDFPHLTEHASSVGAARLKLVGMLAGYLATFTLSVFWIGGLFLFHRLKNPL